MDSSCLSNAAYWQEAGGKQPPPEGKKRKRKTASICEQQEGSRQRKHEPGHSSQHKMKSHTHLSSSFSCSCFVFARSTIIFAMSSPACSALASVSGNARNSSPSAPSTKRPCLLWPGFPAGSPPPSAQPLLPSSDEEDDDDDAPPPPPLPTAASRAMLETELARWLAALPQSIIGVLGGPSGNELMLPRRADDARKLTWEKLCGDVCVCSGN